MYHLRLALAFCLLGFATSVLAVPLGLDSASPLDLASASEKRGGSGVVTRPRDGLDQYDGARCSSKGTTVYIHESGKKRKSKLVTRDANDSNWQFAVPVSWGTFDDQWRTADPSVTSATGIVTYRVGSSDDLFYDWYIEFWAGVTGFYHFTDGAGDSYKVSVDDIGSSHVMRYNSANPTIVEIKGTTNPVAHGPGIKHGSSR